MPDASYRMALEGHEWRVFNGQRYGHIYVVAYGVDYCCKYEYDGTWRCGHCLRGLIRQKGSKLLRCKVCRATPRFQSSLSLAELDKYPLKRITVLEGK